ncbi:MAG TPA: DUF6054 family protein [Clostridia bacterium]|nr:DUF6054 family protein [Clostridia bacterium]
MAKIEATLYGDFNTILSALDRAVMNNSASASFEDGSDFNFGMARCVVRVYERYSMLGDNRVSMSVTLATDGNGYCRLSAITSGGSKAVLFKINTFGEDAFLDTIRDTVAAYGR